MIRLLMMIMAAQLAVLTSVVDAQAVARPGHKHEDLFGEEDLLFGFKLGPEITGYTAIQTGTATVDVQSSTRFVAGAAIKFIYELPRFELDLLWNARGSINKSDTFHALAVPILVKIPLEIEERVDFEFGGGYELDFVMFGAQPRRSVLEGAVAAVGLSVDMQEYVFDFELRYNVGLDDLSDNVNGARPRDFQIIGGLLWHF